MKTGRLIKFDRPGGPIQAYLYRDGDACRAAIYVGTSADRPAHAIQGASESAVEAEARAWIDARFPKA